MRHRFYGPVVSRKGHCLETMDRIPAIGPSFLLTFSAVSIPIDGQCIFRQHIGGPGTTMDDFSAMAIDDKVFL